MPRNMSFQKTKRQMYERTKFVTRRLGWAGLRPGEIINAAEQCQGLKRGSRITIICQIRILEVRSEQLSMMTKAECVLEGFPEMEPVEFVKMFAEFNRCDENAPVNRIAFEFI